MNLPPRLALVGFMGSGKSTVGRVLAERIGYAFVDTDDEVEAEAGTSVAALFRDHGEPAFRAREHAVIRRLVKRDRVVIATGGGAFAQDDSAAELLNGALVVHLRCDFEEAFRRVSHQGGRPLVEKGEIAAAGLYAGRKDKYSRAHVTVDATHRSPFELASDILEAVQQTSV